MVYGVGGVCSGKGKDEGEGKGWYGKWSRKRGRENFSGKGVETGAKRKKNF